MPFNCLIPIGLDRRTLKCDAKEEAYSVANHKPNEDLGYKPKRRGWEDADI
jgi:hypothetical protein